MSAHEPLEGVQWRQPRRGVKEVAGILCLRDSFFSTPDDAKRVQELARGEIYYRERLIPEGDWAAPANLQESLRSSWKFYYHSLVWVSPLRREHRLAPDEALQQGYVSRVRAWLDAFGTPPEPLPTQKNPGDYTWYDMSTAWRTMIIIGALSMIGEDASLLGHLERHAEVLTRAEFYAGIGNHALHQNYALLSASLILDRGDCYRLAIERIEALREISIDDEGVALEGSAGYHLFNLHWWSNMDHLLELVGTLVEQGRKVRVPDMRPFLAQIVAPDGKIIPLGDSTMSRGLYHGVVKEYQREFVEYIESDPQLLHMLTRGLQGERVQETMRVFADGYWFSRAATDGRRPEQQSHATLRFGPGLSTRVHAHDDAGSITFYPRGLRVLEDGGMFGYYGGEKREFVKSNRAHNTLLVEGRKYYRSAVSVLEASASGPVFDQAIARVTAIEQTPWTRIIAHARDHDFLFIQDHVGPKETGFRQLFNLGDGFEVVEVRAGRVDAQTEKGVKVSLIWLDETTRTGLVKGKAAPLLGWRSTFEGELHPVACVTGDHPATEGEGVVKSALVVILLARGEDFSDVSIAAPQFSTSRTRFYLQRKAGRSVCDIMLGQQEMSASALEPTTPA